MVASCLGPILKTGLISDMSFLAHVSLERMVVQLGLQGRGRYDFSDEKLIARMEVSKHLVNYHSPRKSQEHARRKTECGVFALPSQLHFSLSCNEFNQVSIYWASTTFHTLHLGSVLLFRRPEKQTSSSSFLGDTFFTF
jgi:hypothetical protein